MNACVKRSLLSLAVAALRPSAFTGVRHVKVSGYARALYWSKQNVLDGPLHLPNCSHMGNAMYSLFVPCIHMFFENGRLCRLCVVQGSK